MSYSETRVDPEANPARPEGPPPLPANVAVPAFRLSERDQAVARELERIDPQLAGLFQLGMELIGRAGPPGISYLIAEAGRELNVAVINALADTAPELNASELASIDPSDRYRGPIARALRLSPRHPLVDAWADMNRRFNGEAHFVANRTSASSAASDFSTLAELLRGRLAPYFDAQDEADALLALGAPGPEHANALRAILVRPALRTYFLRALQNPAWLPVLKSVRAFVSPPRRMVHSDGSWSLVSWLEGEYLARIASREPAAVAELLLDVPTDNDNPAVWDTVARAAAALPPELAATVLPNVVRGIRALPRVVLPQTLLELGRHVAPVDAAAVGELVNALLWMRRPSMGDAEVPETGGEGGVRPSAARRFSTGWLLEGVDYHDAQEIVDKLLPAIMRVDPWRGLEMLRQKLIAAIRGVDPTDWDVSPRETYWCRELGDPTDRADVRSLFAHALAQHAADVACRSEADARKVATLIERLPSGIGRRILYYLIARCGPMLQERLNALVADPAILDWVMPGREVGEVLRHQFANASPEAQQAFVRLLREGPGQADMEQWQQWASAVGRDASPAAGRAYWQHKHLRRFGARLPEVLQPLADAIGYMPSEPSSEELALTEVGYYSGGASWVTERSPIEPERLRTASIGELAEAVAAWVPEGGIDRPTLRGLEADLAQLAAEEPSRALALARELLESKETPRGLSGILEGLRKACDAKTETPLAELEELLHSILSFYPEARAAEWRQVRVAAIETVQHVFLEEMAQAHLDRLMADVEQLLRDPATWDDDVAVELSTMNGVMAAIYTLAGRAATTLVRLAMLEYNNRLGGEDDNSERAMTLRLELAARLRPSIELILERNGRPAIGARAALGTYLPQLVWLDTPWWTERAAVLVGSGVTDPLGNPIGSAYLAGSRFFDKTFRALRPWYADAARRANADIPSEGSRSWEPERHLIEHVVIAVVRGEASPGDADELVEQAVRNVPVPDLTHAYWTIFRGWSDTEEDDERVPPEFVERLVRFWSWRLDELEQMGPSARRGAEADGLLWFCLTPFVDAADVLRLGRRTIRIASGDRGALHSLMDRLPELASADVDGAFLLMADIVEVELRGQYPHPSVADLGPVFEAAFMTGSASTKAAAVALLNRLGDAGFSEFGQLRPR